MKIAFVNCWTMPGGVLNVLQDLMIKQLRKHGKEVEVRLFTLISDRESLKLPLPWGNGAMVTIPIVQTLPKWINQIFLFFTKRKVKVLSGIFDYRNLMVFYPRLMKLLSFKIKKWKPDEIQISSFAIAKNITPIPWVPTHLYLHSPMQYIWSHYDEYDARLTWWKNRLFNFIVPRLRKWDLKFHHFDSVVCNSHYTQELAEELYSLKSTVSYPKIADQYWFAWISPKPMPYFVYVGRLVNFVRETGLIIQLFNRLKLPLVVIGSGPDEEELKALAGETIIFTGWNPEGMTEIVRDSAGLINLTKESFWIWTVEALLMGVPVFGFAEGATAELVDEDCGVLVKSKKLEDLVSDFELFRSKRRDRKLISERIREKMSSNS